METNARFILKDARVTRVKNLEKVSFIGVKVQAGKFPSNFDVTVFNGVDVPPSGAAVTISGELQMRKPKDENGRWEVQLIARKIDPADDRKAPKASNSPAVKPAEPDDIDELGF